RTRQTHLGRKLERTPAPFSRRGKPFSEGPVTSAPKRDRRQALLRILGYTRPHAARRNALIGLVVVRALQLPLIAWAIGAIIGGAVARLEWKSIVLQTLGLGALIVVTQVVFAHRIRVALQLGEEVVFDMRREIFAHLLRMPMSFFE